MKFFSWLQSFLIEDEKGITLRISKEQLQRMTMIWVILMIVLVGFGMWGMAREAEVQQLRQDNELQRSQLKLLDQKVDILDKKMNTLNELDASIRNMIKGTESGTIPSSTNSTTTSDEKEDPSPGRENNTYTTTQLSAHISRLDLQAQRRIASMYTLYRVLQEGVGKDIQELQSLLVLQGEEGGPNSAIPSLWPAKGVITSTFGGRQDPVNGGGAFHEGLDIANDEGTPVVATASGKVIYTGYNGGYGNMVDIDHGNGFVTRYGHNSVLLVQEGMIVKRGQTIALMGSTGKSTGSHVHYEVRIHNVPTDPILFLPIQ